MLTAVASKRKKLILMISLALGIVLLSALFIIPNLTTHSSSQSDYPALPHPTLVATYETTLEEQLDSADFVIDATVMEVKPEVQTTYTPEKGSAEEKLQEKGVDYTSRKLPIALAVNEVCQGEYSSDTITIYISAFAIDCIPDFQPGDRALFLLKKFGEEYGTVTLQESFFYIADDQKVYPANYTESLKETSGMRLSQWKDYAASLKKQDKE
ncbi:MAG: hypothetical protein HFE39_08945 [Clostridiales bacterium]|jgi:hypothetical protein|nr:hypothetical protein [Clostridiales bacterium]